MSNQLVLLAFTVNDKGMLRALCIALSLSLSLYYKSHYSSCLVHKCICTSTSVKLVPNILHDAIKKGKFLVTIQLHDLIQTFSGLDCNV